MPPPSATIFGRIARPGVTDRLTGIIPHDDENVIPCNPAGAYGSNRDGENPHEPFHISHPGAWPARCHPYGYLVAVIAAEFAM